MAGSEKKLLVLHLKGLLIDCYHESRGRPRRKPDAKVGRFYVYRRPGWEEFVQFCLKNFVVGIWSSAYKHNVNALAAFTFGDATDKLAFIWNKDHCTEMSMRHPDNPYKPMVAKEISKLWSRRELPWKKGDFGPSNTVLIDDDPYSSRKNEVGFLDTNFANTTIMVKTYSVKDPEVNDIGKLREYLEGLADANDVRAYIKAVPFDQFIEDDLLPSPTGLRKNIQGPGDTHDDRQNIKEKSLDKLLACVSLEDSITVAKCCKDPSEIRTSAASSSNFRQVPSASRFPSRHFLSKTKVCEARESASKVESSVKEDSLSTTETSAKREDSKTDFSNTKNDSHSESNETKKEVLSSTDHTVTGRKDSPPEFGNEKYGLSGTELVESRKEIQD